MTKKNASSQRTELPITIPGASTVLKLHPELPDCLSLPKSDTTHGDIGHPVNLNSVIMDVAPEGKPDVQREKNNRLLVNRE